MNLIYFENAGPEIAKTNFWDSEHAQHGLLHLSPNAGVLRLLVPPNQEPNLSEMHTGKKVTVESSILIPGQMDIVFEDGTPAPFFVCLDHKQCSGIPERGNWRLAVWTRDGKQMELACKVKSTGNARQRGQGPKPGAVCIELYEVTTTYIPGGV